jgi:hypothetical protein
MKWVNWNYQLSAFSVKLVLEWEERAGREWETWEQIHTCGNLVSEQRWDYSL